MKDLLNTIAAALNTTDKNLVYSATIKLLCDQGLKPRDAYEAVFGPGAWDKFAGQVHAALTTAA